MLLLPSGGHNAIFRGNSHKRNAVDRQDDHSESSSQAIKIFYYHIWNNVPGECDVLRLQQPKCLGEVGHGEAAEIFQGT